MHIGRVSSVTLKREQKIRKKNITTTTIKNILVGKKVIFSFRDSYWNSFHCRFCMNFHFYIDSNELCRHCKYEWTHLDNIMVDTPSKSRNLCNFCNYLGIHDTHRLCQGSNLSDKFNISYCLSKSHILRLNYREHRQLSHNNKRLYILSRHH